MNPHARRRQSVGAPFPAQAVPTRPLPTAADRRAIISVAGQLIGRAGRTVLMMGLRGSQARRVLQHDVGSTRGYGHYAGRPEAEVLAHIDALIAENILCLRYREGFPLLGYTDQGLALAMRYAAEDWFEVLCSRVQPVANGAALDLPFLVPAMPQRNHNTVLLVVKLAGAVADKSWLPLLHAWRETEIRRVRAQLTPLITKLERQ